MALLGLLLGLVAGVLLLVDALEIGRSQTIDLAFVLDRIAQILVSLVILFGSLLLYRGKSSAGGLVLLVLGVVVLILGWDQTSAVLAIVGGILGVVASEAFK